MRRLETSASLIYMKLPYAVEELVAGTHELLAANGLPACYIRPIAFYGYGTLGVPPRQNPVEVVIMSWPWGAYLGADALERGISAKVSTWRRVGPNTIPHAAKATGVYLNSMLAVLEASRAGYDEAILLTEDGYVGDGSGENLFAVKDGVLYTPDLSASILPGITRSSIVRIAADLGYEVREKPLIRTDLYVADELFMTGTAAEVTPIRAVDDHEIGDPGPVTKAIQRMYLDTVTGKVDRYAEWLEHVPASSAVPSS
jgi:branched-chain amino acid aminotransferase